MKEKVFELKMKGYCCSQIVMQIGLEYIGKENEELVEAMAGLCEGVKCGKICGAVSAASCLIHLADGKEAGKGLVDDFIDWFEEAFGSLECAELLGNDPMAKIEKCPMFVESTLSKLEDLLEWE